MIEGEGAQLRVSGPMTVDTATQLAEQGAALLTQGPRELDLAAVTRVDSSAVAVVLAWARAARTAGHELHLRNLPASFTSLIRLYGVDEVLAAGVVGA